MILKAIPSATSSQALEDGVSPCAPQDGPIRDLFGHEVPHANPLPLRASTRARTMPATCSHAGSASLPSASLQQFMENNLQTQLPKGGLMMFTRGWRVKVTPLGRRYFQLAASGRPTCGSAFGLWPTPRCRGEEGALTVLARKGEVQVMHHNLTSAAQAAMWVPQPWQATQPIPFGEVVRRYPATMEKNALLNPTFACWLMGFPTAALSCMHWAMQSCRR